MIPSTRRIVFTNATDTITTAATDWAPPHVATDGTIYIKALPPTDPMPVILNRAAERRYQRTGKVDYKARRLEPWQRKGER